MKNIFPLIILFSLFVSCTKKETKKNKILRLALSSDATSLDTAMAYDTISSKVVAQTNEPLFQYHYLNRPYQLIPLLAKSMPEISDNGLTYTIKIKEGIKYHSHSSLKKGRTVKAIDFVDQIKRIAFMPTKSNGWWLFDNKIVGLNDFRSKANKDLSDFFKINVPGLQAIDSHTLVIKLTRPYPQLVYALSMTFTAPTPREFIIDKFEDFDRGVVGTGPFYLKSWNNNLRIKLVKFKNYHSQTYPTSGDQISHKKNLLKYASKKLPFLDGIEFSIIKEAQTRWLSFMKNKIDIIVLSREHFPLALNAQGKLSDDIKAQNINLQIASTLTYWWLSFNMTDKILGNNLRLRQAIAHAVDIDSYIKIFTNNIALKANSIYPPGVLGYDPNNELNYKYDLEKSKSLLAQAGYPNGRGLPTIAFDVRGNSTVSRQMGEYIQKELAKIGVKIKVIINPFSQFLRKAKNGELQFWQGGWALDYPSAENIVQLLYSKNKAPGPNTSFYNNQSLDTIYEQLSKTDDTNKILKLTKEAEKIVADDLPWIMQYYSRNYILFHSNVKNYRQADLIYNDLKYIDIIK